MGVREQLQTCAHATSAPAVQKALISLRYGRQCRFKPSKNLIKALQTMPSEGLLFCGAPGRAHYYYWNHLYFFIKTSFCIKNGLLHGS